MSSRGNATLGHAFSERIASISALDRPARAVANAVSGLLGEGGGIKDVLSGTWLGHALHPMLSDVPIGAWTSATVLDLLGGRASRSSAEKLVGVGLLAAGPTAWSGWADWSDGAIKRDAHRRIGAVHALANGAATALYGASLVARRRGAHRSGVALGLVGAGAMGVGGWLGGDLALGRGVGVNQSLFHDQPLDWTYAIDASALADDRPATALVGDLRLVIVKRGDTIHALGGRCTHRGGMLHDGQLIGDCIVCPLHGAHFRLADGSIARGPAAHPQPLYDVRVTDGRVEVRATAP